MWYLIKRTVKDPHSPSVLKVQWVLDGKTKDYSIEEDVENAIQRECEIRFSLAHSAPIMSTLLGDRLRYLGDEELARSIITVGVYTVMVCRWTDHILARNPLLEVEADLS